MGEQSVEVKVVVDAKIYHRFTVFDNLFRKRGLAAPVVFACIVCGGDCLFYIF
ncbi:MAG: hypothetical protein FWE32_11950 [Oscillospiraceae bacterium]|nr:hypothetical protein [Oscillospiraceae bacterium]